MGHCKQCTSNHSEVRMERELEDPESFAAILMRRLRLSDDRAAFRDAEEVIYDAMNEALNQARAVVAKSPRWGVEAIDSLRARLNTQK